MNENKPKCVLVKFNVEHLIVRALKVIRLNYSLEEARQFYVDTYYVRNNYNLVKEMASKFVEIEYE